MLDDDGVVLTEHERDVLTALASTIDDGWLAHQLAGGDPPPSALPRWLAPALLVLGVFVTIAIFTRWWWVGGSGLVLMGLAGWLTWRRTCARPAPGPDEGCRDRTLDDRDTHRRGDGRA
ncbi:MAG: hypothetical protein ACRELA_11230 [Candidatus Rokuibacteriota bacterium]